jgi:hypothetical protein
VRIRNAQRVDANPTTNLPVLGNMKAFNAEIAEITEKNPFRKFAS